MAILIDYSQVAISSLMAHVNNKSFDGEIDTDLIRHMILNALRNFRNNHKDKYGEVVICCDDKNYWRRDYFPYYKAQRKQARYNDGYDWTSIFENLEQIKSELREHFPYKVIQVEKAEADDIIATVVKYHASPLEGGTSFEPCLIVSGDKDFIQLHRYGDTSQWSPIQHKWVRGNPEKYLQEHILKGDRGDGIPNVLSKDDIFVSNGRQTPMRQKKMDDIIADLEEGELLYAASWYAGYCRNKTLIDLSEIPSDIQSQIVDFYSNSNDNDRSKLFNYFIEHRLKHLTEHISEF